MKEDRQTKILEIIENHEIENQNELISRLKQAGYNSTQATISRDIKELHIIKEPTSLGGFRYTVRGRAEISNADGRLRTIFRESVISFECAMNLVVIKTLPGLASAACSAIDAMDIKGLVGTIAGDDTAFLAMRDEDLAESFCRDIKNLM